MKIALTNKEQYEKLIGKVGNRVAFSYPEKRKDNQLMGFDTKKQKWILEGKLEHRCAVNVEDSDLVAYWYIVDLIRFKGEKELWLRVTYYRYLKKKIPRWVFAGQTSLSGPISYFQKFFKRAIKGDECIREYLNLF